MGAPLAGGGLAEALARHRVWGEGGGERWALARRPWHTLTWDGGDKGPPPVTHPARSCVERQRSPAPGAPPPKLPTLPPSIFPAIPLPPALKQAKHQSARHPECRPIPGAGAQRHQNPCAPRTCAGVGALGWHARGFTGGWPALQNAYRCGVGHSSRYAQDTSDIRANPGHSLEGSAACTAPGCHGRPRCSGVRTPGITSPAALCSQQRLHCFTMFPTNSIITMLLTDRGPAEPRDRIEQTDLSEPMQAELAREAAISPGATLGSETAKLLARGVGHHSNDLGPSNVYRQRTKRQNTHLSPHSP